MSRWEGEILPTEGVITFLVSPMGLIFMFPNGQIHFPRVKRLQERERETPPPPVFTAQSLL